MVFDVSHGLPRVNRNEGTRGRVIRPGNILLKASTNGNTVNRAMLLIRSVVRVVICRQTRKRFTITRLYLGRQRACDAYVVGNVQIGSTARVTVGLTVLVMRLLRAEDRVDRRAIADVCVITMDLVTDGLVDDRRDQMNGAPLVTYRTRSTLLRVNVTICIKVINRLFTYTAVGGHDQYLPVGVNGRAVRHDLRLVRDERTVVSSMNEFRRVRQDVIIICLLNAREDQDYR